MEIKITWKWNNLKYLVTIYTPGSYSIPSLDPWLLPVQSWTKGAWTEEVYIFFRQRERGVNECVSMAALCCEKEHKYFEATC